MEPGQVAQAVAMFAVTNIDDILILALFFGQATGRRDAAKVVFGQYLGFAGILGASIAGAFGAGLLPSTVTPYLGLLPILLGLRAAWLVWRDRHAEDEETVSKGPSLLGVAGITFANGGDNIGVYVPVFASAGKGTLVVYAVVFLVLVGVWCAIGRFLATRPVVARALSRWGHVVLPVVLIGIGLLILIEGL